MTSFAVECEPRPQPRLAAGALLVHLLAATWPWFTRCAPGIAAALSLIAILGLAATLARLPGAHCRLQALSFRGDGWHFRLRGSAGGPASIGRGTRVHAGLIAIEVRAGRRCLGWLLTRGAMDPDQFRRLKARLRLAC